MAAFAVGVFIGTLIVHSKGAGTPGIWPRYVTVAPGQCPRRPQIQSLTIGSILLPLEYESTSQGFRHVAAGRPACGRGGGKVHCRADRVLGQNRTRARTAVARGSCAGTLPGWQCQTSLRLPWVGGFSGGPAAGGGTFEDQTVSTLRSRVRDTGLADSNRGWWQAHRGAVCQPAVPAGKNIRQEKDEACFGARLKVKKPQPKASD